MLSDPQTRAALAAATSLPTEVFTLAEATRRGWSPSALQYAVRVGRVERLRGGVFRPVTTDSAGPATDVRRRTALAVAASRTVSDSVVSHGSAADLWGIACYPTPRRACLTVPPRLVGRIAHVHLHRATLPVEAVRMAGICVTAPARTVLDVARESGLEAGVVAIDSALHLGLTDDDELQRALTACRGWPGSRRAAAAFQLRDGLSESALESRSRLAILRAGLPAPRLQARMYDDRGVFIGRVDFLWEEARLIGECDGMGKYTDSAVLREERIRQGRLERIDHHVERWTWSDLTDFAPVAERLRRHLG